MAEKNTKYTPFQLEQKEIFSTLKTYKLSCESNIVSMIFKEPDLFFDCSLTIDDFTNENWQLFFAIAKGILVDDKKSTLDSVTVGMYLEKHPKMKKKYEEYNGYEMVVNSSKYVQEKNFDAYVAELHKWSAVMELCKAGFPVKQRMSDFADMQEEDIYQMYELDINHIFINADSATKSYNIFDGMEEFVEKLDTGAETGIPFINSPRLTEMTGGFNINGNIYGLGGNSGVGKSTLAFNLLVPSVIQYNEKIVFIINEEDENKFKRELLVWVANNVVKKDLTKTILRDGKFNDETKEVLKECVEWIDTLKDKQLITVIPLEHYSVDIAIKIIKKYSAIGVRMFVLDTLKESFDAKTDEIYKSMMRDMIKLYDTVKPSNKNVGLFVTYQLGKSSLKLRYFTNNEIGQAKSIVDVMSVNIMMRRPYDDEYNGANKALKCISKSQKGFEAIYPLEKDKSHMILFVTKNRFGETNTKQIVCEFDLGRNIYKDVAHCYVPQDF